MQHITSVALGTKHDTVFAVQGDPSSDASARVGTSIGVAMMEPMENSFRQLAQPQAAVHQPAQVHQPVAQHV